MPWAGTRQPRGIAKRQTILQVATQLLIDSGMVTLTHRRVAQTAGVPLGAIRYYFKTRESLLIACIDLLETERHHEAEKAIRSVNRYKSSISFKHAAKHLLHCYYGPRLDDLSLRGILGWVVDSSRESPILADHLHRQRQGIDQQMRRLLDALGYQGILAQVVDSVIDGAILSAVVEAQSAIADAVITMVAQLLRTLRDSSPPRAVSH